MKELGPRERLLEFGPKTLTDRELLCVILRTGTASPQRERPGVFQLVEILFDRFGGLDGILSSSAEELDQVSGLGPVKIATLLAIREFSRRAFVFETERGQRPKINSASQAYRLFQNSSDEPQEVVQIALLTSRNRLIRKKEIFRGTLTETPGQARELIREALRANAAKFIVAHNHPSGEVDPSPQDLLFTEHLHWAARIMGVPLVDHLIIGAHGKYFSFVESGLLPVGESLVCNAQESSKPSSKVVG